MSPFEMVRFELGSGSAAGLFAWRAALSNEDVYGRFTSEFQREAGRTPVHLYLAFMSVDYNTVDMLS